MRAQPHGEDEFLWGQRRAMIVLALGIFTYGVFEKPRLLLLTPLLAYIVLFAVSRILRDNGRRAER